MECCYTPPNKNIPLFYVKTLRTYFQKADQTMILAKKAAWKHKPVHRFFCKRFFPLFICTILTRLHIFSPRFFWDFSWTPNREVLSRFLMTVFSEVTTEGARKLFWKLFQSEISFIKGGGNVYTMKERKGRGFRITKQSLEGEKNPKKIIYKTLKLFSFNPKT